MHSYLLRRKLFCFPVTCSSITCSCLLNGFADYASGVCMVHFDVTCSQFNFCMCAIMILKKWVISVELTTIFVCALMFQVDYIWSQVL